MPEWTPEMQAWVDEQVAKAPPLTDEQAEQIAALFRTADPASGAAPRDAA